MHTTPSAVMLAVILSATSIPAAAQSFVVDLGLHQPGRTEEVSVPAGMQGSVMVLSRLPTKKYSITTRIRVVPIEPLSTPGAAAGSSGTDICVIGDTARIVERALAAVTQEQDVAAKIAELRGLGQTCMTAPPVVAMIDAEARRLTVSEVAVVTIDAGQELEVRVVRDEATVWTVVFSAGPRGAWHALYGFMFTPNFDKTYFTQPESGKFRVTEQFASTADLNFIPSVFFSWMPASRENKNFNWSWTGGLGFDQANPAVFGGGLLSFNHNVSAVGGLVFQRQQRLAGNYQPDALPLVEASLTPEQLSRATFRVNLFVGLAFRFNANPFATPKKDEPKTEDPKATPQPETKKGS